MTTRMNQGRGFAPVRHANCMTCERRAEEWCSLGDDLSTLNDAKTCNVYQAGQVIFYQGNPCLGLHCIEAGTVALRKGDALGNEVLLRLAHDGETLGVRAFFSLGKYSAAAVALTECRVCFIERPAVESLLAQNQQTTQMFLKNIACKLHDAEESKMQLTTLSVRTRLAHLLLELKDHYGVVDEGGTLRIELPLSRQDMASMIATRPETLSRTIKALEKDRVALFDKRSVSVFDLDALFDEVESPRL